MNQVAMPQSPSICTVYPAADKHFFQKNGTLSVEIQPPALSVLGNLTQFMPMIGASLAHNFVQHFLLQRHVQYIRDPILNSLANLPISASVGAVAFLAAKSFVSPKEQGRLLTDQQGVETAIAWATIYNLIQTTLNANIFTPSISISLAAVHIFLSAQLFDFAEAFFANPLKQEMV